MCLALFNPRKPMHCFDEDTSSSSSSSSTTTNINQNAAAGDDSTVVVASGSTVNVTDGGAVKDAFGFAKSVAEGAFNQVAASRADVTKTAESALAGVMASTEQIKDAYSEAKAGEQKVLVGVGLVIVGIVAFNAMRK